MREHGSYVIQFCGVGYLVFACDADSSCHLKGAVRLFVWILVTVYLASVNSLCFNSIVFKFMFCGVLWTV